MNTIIRLGLDCARPGIMALGEPILVSANSLWDQKRHRFRKPFAYIGRDVALDSGGFVAMKCYGGYRWSPHQYAHLAAEMKPTWWAQMDYCCEPEIAASPGEVHRRIDMTVDGLHACRSAAASICGPAPMPVLQGYEPGDYVHGPIYSETLPELLGVGSVCRRHLKGKHGLMAVIDALDRKLPKSCRLHLFGVKNTALAGVVSEFPHRHFSSDSMAYSFSARIFARENQIPNTSELRAKFASKWLIALKASVTPKPQEFFNFGEDS